VGDKAHLWNDRYQLQALKRLLAALPETTMPAPGSKPQSLHRVAKRLKEHQVKALVEAYKSGATVYELADSFGIERRTVSNILKREGVETRWRRLTEEDIDEVVRLYATGLSAARIADRFGVNADTVRYQLRKRGVKMRGPHERP
jgi:DNA-binding CsgD family transcriptional regulator